MKPSLQNAEEIVISGYSGQFPNCQNVNEFYESLLEQKDLITTTERWHRTFPDLPTRYGLISGYGYFDAQFFDMKQLIVDNMDPQIRMGIEKAYECIVDAGINPKTLRGSKTGVYVGNCVSEQEKFSMYNENGDHPDGLAITGTFRGMIANQVSYYLDLKGPSCVLDTACSSSMFAFERAYSGLRNGDCDSAIVIGTNLLLHPVTSVQFNNAGMLSPLGQSRPFDDAALGYVRSEAVCCVFLQRVSQARRVYGFVVHAKTNCDGYTPEGLTCPSAERQTELLNEFYREIDMRPEHVDFVEAHGTGTPVGDPEELKAIDNAIAMKRASPLLVGSVKSNIGHTEAASGVCSIIKALFILDRGHLLPNINFSSPRKVCASLLQGRIQVATKVAPYKSQYVALNSFGMGGANAHVLLKRFRKKTIEMDLQFPRLVCVSGRTEEAVKKLLKSATQKPLNAQYCRLIQSLFQTNEDRHPYRGYVSIYENRELKQVIQRSQKLNPPHLSIIFGDNIDHTLASKLMRIPSFAQAIDQCQTKLLPMHIKDVLLKEFDMLTRQERVVVLVATQIGLVNVFENVGLEFMVAGENYGAVTSAYVDGLFDADQCVLIGYLMETFRSGKDAGSLAKLQNIRTKKSRKNKWIGSHRFQNAAEFVKGMNESPRPLTEVPTRTVYLQIGSSIHNLKTRTIQYPSQDVHDHFDELLVLIGRLYLEGFQVDASKLSPSISFPVASGTPAISPHILWDHHRHHHFDSYDEINLKLTEFRIPFSIKDDELAFNTGHIIDGQNLIPATAYLLMVWQHACEARYLTTQKTAVIFRDVRFLRATATQENYGALLFNLNMQICGGRFEVMESSQLIVTGYIEFPSKIDDIKQVSKPSPKDVLMTRNDVYKELRLRGYEYKGEFRGIKECTTDGTYGQLSWNNNYVTFMDTMLQMSLLRFNTKDLYVPTRIDKLCIDPVEHVNRVEGTDEDPTFSCYYDSDEDVIRAGAVQIYRPTVTKVPRRVPIVDVIEEVYTFVPYFDDRVVDRINGLRIIFQLVDDCLQLSKVKIVEVYNGLELLLVSALEHVFEKMPVFQADLTVVSATDDLEVPDAINAQRHSLMMENHVNVVIACDLLSDEKKLTEAISCLKTDGLIISRDATPELHVNVQTHFIASQVNTGVEYLTVLLPMNPQNCNYQEITSDWNFEWLDQLKPLFQSTKPLVVFAKDNLTDSKGTSGILGLINCLKKERKPNCKVFGFFVMDTAPPFDPADPFYKSQIDKSLMFNVWKNGRWGAYRHLTFEPLDNIISPHAFIEQTVYGNLSSFTWRSGYLNDPKDTNIGKVYYAALNFRDVMLATGKLAEIHNAVKPLTPGLEVLQGLEFSGRLSSGVRVMGMVPGGAMATSVAVDHKFMWTVPESWSLAEAATVPVVYCTAYYALVTLGRIKTGQTALIHAGTGGVGQAAIRLALSYGCVVFTTVGTDEKREFIRKTFPEIDESHIGNSRDTSFEAMIKIRTRGKGVDIVLNSLADDKLQASLRCLAENGTFLEIGKYDLVNNSTLGINCFARGASFHGVILDDFFHQDHKIKDRLNGDLCEGIRNGVVKPIERSVFRYDQVEQAYRFMATGKHIGKVILEIRPEEDEKIIQASMVPIPASPRFYCNPNKSYVFIGGLGGFGLEVITWFVTRRCRNILIVSTRGITNGYQSRQVNYWRSLKCQVQITTADVSTETGCTSILEQAKKMGSVDSIFNMAMSLRDGLLMDQTVDNFQESFRGKALATQNMDQISRKLCPELQHFVVFSSGTSGRGNIGQTNYGMSNSTMERICEKRFAQGLPALAIQWNAIGDVGVLFDNKEIDRHVEVLGTLPQRIHSCLNVLNRFLTTKRYPVVGSMVVAEGKRMLGENLQESIANILGIKNLSSVSQHSTLTELGVDSMMAIEIKQTLERDYELVLTTREIRALTFATLKTLNTQSNNQKQTDQAPDNFMQLISLFPNEESSMSTFITIPSLYTTTLAETLLESTSDNNKSTPLFMIPGVEGVCTLFGPLCAKISYPTFGIQVTSDNSFETIEEIAMDVSKNITTNLRDAEPFHIIAHSFGTLIALELAYLLEAKGYSGKMILVDGSPLIMRELLYQRLINVDDDNAFDSAVLFSIYTVMKRTNIEEFFMQFNQILSWQAKKERLSEIIQQELPEIKHSRDYQHKFCDAIRNKCKAIKNYQPEAKPAKLTRTEIHLVKPNVAMSLSKHEDYDLSRYVDDVKITYFDGDHLSVLENEEFIQFVVDLF